MKQKFTLFFLCCLIYSCQTDETLVLNEGKVYEGLHQDNVGKIAFMDQYIPFKECKQTDFLDSILLTDSTDLYIRGFMDKTLTWYLHELAPELSVEELCEKGNFQFSFTVNGLKIYTENLSPKAGLCSFKNSSNVFSVPLVSTKNEDSWGVFLWLRMLKRGGGEAVFYEGSHNVEIEIRPYIKGEKFKIGNVIAKGAVKIKIKKPEVVESQVMIQPIQPDSGFEVSRDSFNEGRIHNLKYQIADKTFKDLTSIVVVKEGKLILEEYFNGADRATLHDTRSVGKTFASTITGIALDDGHLKSVDSEIKQFYDLGNYENRSSKKEMVTIESLLTMTSGLNGSDLDSKSPGHEEKMYPTKDWVKFVLDLPMDPLKEIGKNWDYFTGGTVLLGDILNSKVPGGLEKYTNEKLFKPLGIEQFKWQYTPTNVPNTAGSLQLRSLDYAKFGQMYKDHGQWNGKQVIPEAWAKTSTDRLKKIPFGDRDLHYGYLFWNKTIDIHRKPQQVAYASGNGGNTIFIFKDLPLVIVITATAYNKPYSNAQVDQLLSQLAHSFIKM